MTEFAILYRHTKCGQLSASKIILSEKEILDTKKNIELKAKHSRKYCTRCKKFIRKPNYLYNTPMYIEKSQVYSYLAKESNLY